MLKLSWILAIALNIIIPFWADTASAQGQSFRSSPGNAISISRGQSVSIIAQRDGGSLQYCMASWDLATHMTKQEWRAACIRRSMFILPAGRADQKSN